MICGLDSLTLARLAGLGLRFDLGLCVAAGAWVIKFHGLSRTSRSTLIAGFMGPTLGPSGADRTQVGPMLTPWILLSVYISSENTIYTIELLSYLIYSRWCTIYGSQLTVTRRTRRIKTHKKWGEPLSCLVIGDGNSSPVYNISKTQLIL